MTPALETLTQQSHLGYTVNFSTNVTAIAADALTRQSRLTLESWVREVRIAVERLLQLPDGWDGPTSHRVDTTAVRVTLDFINLIAREVSILPLPTICPTPYSGVFVEWQHDRSSVSFEIQPESTNLAPSPVVIELYCFDAHTKIEWEGTLADADASTWWRSLNSFTL